jgi:hypothetical protein
MNIKGKEIGSKLDLRNDGDLKLGNQFLLLLNELAQLLVHYTVIRTRNKPVKTTGEVRVHLSSLESLGTAFVRTSDESMLTLPRMSSEESGGSQ